MNYYFAGACTGECAKSLEPIFYSVLIILLLICIFAFFVARTFYKRYKLSHSGSLLSKKQKIVVLGIAILIMIPFGINRWNDFQGRTLRNKRYSEERACKIAIYGEGARELEILMSGGGCDFRGMPQYKGH